MKKTVTGFTIVELLIVIVVIAILATISIVIYNGVQDRAHQAKIASDISSIVNAIQAARISTGKTLLGMTGNTYTAGSCTSKPSGTDLAKLSSSDACLTSYAAVLGHISTASGAVLGDLRDPWGRPYMIDENEGESGGCSKDTVAASALAFTSGSGAYATTPRYNVPLSGFTGCS